jgi:hypothetical protein
MEKETVEEAARKYATNHGMMAYVFPEKEKSFIDGAKWQAERMYSEEEVKQIITNAFNQGERYGWDTEKSIEDIDEMRGRTSFMSLEKYLEQFKKK